MADITASVVSWSTTESGNQPTDSTAIGAGLDDNLRAIQAGTAREFAKGSDLPSASTVDIGASGTSGFVDITGSATITSLGTARAGLRRWVRFTGSLTLTHNATSLILPGAANITTQAGDVALFISLGSGNWVCVQYPNVLSSPRETTNGVTGNGSTAINCNTAAYYVMTMTGNVTSLSFSAVPATPRAFALTLEIVQGGVGGYTIAWPGTIKWPSNLTPTLTTTVGKTDVVTLVTRDGGVSWLGFVAGQNF